MNPQGHLGTALVALGPLQGWRDGVVGLGALGERRELRGDARVRGVQAREGRLELRPHVDFARARGQAWQRGGR